MRVVRAAITGAVLAALASALPEMAAAASRLACGPFTTAPLAAPAPRGDAHSLLRLRLIDQAAEARPYPVLFLGDSITERWEDREGAGIWRAAMAPRGVLNAGIDGDRTEHLLWRLDHGNLDGPPPRLVVVLIGTNDLGHGRSPAVAAEGIRAVLLRLRAREPGARLLLLGLWPRSRNPQDRLRREVREVNRLISTCQGGAITYADIGGVLLDPRGYLKPGISPDALHFSASGYALLAPRLDRLIDRLLAGR